MTTTTRDDVIKVLRRASELVQGGWIRRDYAVDANGNSVELLDPTASCFCLAGALFRAGHDILGTDREWQAEGAVYFTLKREFDEEFITTFNDAPNRNLSDITNALVLAEQYVDEVLS